MWAPCDAGKEHRRCRAGESPRPHRRAQRRKFVVDRLNLGAGEQATIVVEYWEGNGTAAMRLLWVTPGNTSAVIVPAGSLLPN